MAYDIANLQVRVIYRLRRNAVWQLQGVKRRETTQEGIPQTVYQKSSSVPLG